VPELGHAMERLREDRFSAKDVIGEKFPGGRQRAAVLSALYQLQIELPFQIGDVFGDRRLTDRQIGGGPREGALAGHRPERA
jgi:hypothetical protein